MYKRIPMKNLHLHDINPRVCGIRTCEPCFTVGPLLRDHFILHYVVSGHGVYERPGERYRVQPGEIFVEHPGAMGTYIADAQDPWEYIWAAFDCSEAYAQMLPHPILYAPWAASVFARIIACDCSAAREWMMCAQLHAFFAALAAQRAAASQPSPEDSVSRALSDIHSNYAQPLQIGEIAAGLGLNRSHFCRLFHAHVGMSPQAYLTSYRLEKAVEFLTVHRLSQKETALLVGYADVAAFSKMFKRKYGVAPGVYAAGVR